MSGELSFKSSLTLLVGLLLPLAPHYVLAEESQRIAPPHTSADLAYFQGTWIDHLGNSVLAVIPLPPERELTQPINYRVISFSEGVAIPAKVLTGSSSTCLATHSVVFSDAESSEVVERLIPDMRQSDSAFAVYDLSPGASDPFGYVVESRKRKKPLGLRVPDATSALAGKWVMPNLRVGAGGNHASSNPGNFFEISRLAETQERKSTNYRVRYADTRIELSVESLFDNGCLRGSLPMPSLGDGLFHFELIPNPSDSNSLFLEATGRTSAGEKHTVYFWLVREAPHKQAPAKP